MISDKLKKLLEDVGEDPRDACWQVRQGTYAIKHKALERIATELGITFDEPKPLEVGPDFVAVCVTGHLGDVSEWSIGEASSATSHNKYFCAMAEKRAKDRVILKLIGIHGDTYSEEEADSFKAEAGRIEELTRAGKALMAHVEFVRENWKTVAEMKQAIEEDDVTYANQLHEEFSNEEKELLLGLATTKGGIFTTAERQYFRSNESNQARKEINRGK